MKTKFLLTTVLIIYVTQLFAQPFGIKGTVFDTQNEALIGVNIMIEGTSIGTVTDINGKFNLKISNKSSVIVFSYLGFKTLKKQVEDVDFSSVILVEDIESLEEVVVIGYGVQKKSDITFSIASVKSDDIASSSVSSLDQGLQGRVAGVVVTQTSGQPGAATSIRIRGTTSINGKNEPLYVIDGIPIISDASDMSSTFVQGPKLNPLAGLNPNDIESMEILKDASASAIYGARGSNGVILITTKKGVKGDAKISIDVYKGFQEVRKKMPMLNAKQLAELGNEAADNSKVPRINFYASPVNLGVGTNWQNEIFRIAPITNIQFSVRGGSKQVRYSLSSNYFNQEGIIINSDYQKGTFNMNLDADVSDKLKIGGGVNYTRSISNGIVTDSEGATASSITSLALSITPATPVFDANGKYTKYDLYPGSQIANPVSDAKLATQISTINRFMGNAYLSYEIIKGLNYRFSFGGDIYFNKDQSYIPKDIVRGQGKGKALVADMSGFTWICENTLSYLKSIKKHNFNLMVAYSIQAYESEITLASSEDFQDERLGYYSLQSGKDKNIFTGYSEWQMLSKLGRIIYNYDRKYYITFSGRIDGSSKFGSEERYGFFPSISSAWRLSSEKFIKNIKSISDLKLRIGYGSVGNEGIPPYSSKGLLKYTEAYYGESSVGSGYAPKSIENENLKWEVSDQYNIGLDIGLLSNKVSITVDAYYKKTSDLLLNTPIVSVSGFDNAYINIGDMENYGFELALKTVIFDNEFKWFNEFNISTNTNKVTSLADIGDKGILGHSLLGINDWTRITEGKSIGTIYGYKSDGVIQLKDDLNKIPYFSTYNSDYGVRKYIDQDGNKIINEDDKVELGNANPDFTFGFNNTFTYKIFTLNIYLQGVYGNEIVNFNRFSLESFDGKTNNSAVALDRWTYSNPTNEYPRASLSTVPNVLSDVQVEDGSYIRLKDISFSVNLNRKFLQKYLYSKLSINHLKFYVTGKNLYTLTNYSGYDPEVSRFASDARSMGADYGSYPTSKTILFGMNINF